MSRRTRGTVYRKTKARTDRNGNRKTVKAGFYRGRYTTPDGLLKDHVLELPNGKGTTDRDVANKLLNDILTRLDREAVGLIDPRLEDARTPMRVILARYLRHLRRNRCGRQHVEQVC